MIEDFSGGGASIFSNRLNEDENYLYHYTSAATLARIVEGRTFRMGPYSKTNDPRETSSWSNTISADVEGAFQSPEDVRDLWALIRDVRQGVKVACFTLDSEIEEDGVQLPFHRGWARARMWHQYAQGHTGACLIFDRTAWERTLRDAGAAESLRVYDGAVRYEDVRMAYFSSILDFPAAQLVAGEASAVVTRIVDEHRDALFFTKNTDWESEKEHRYLAISDSDEVYVSVSESLVGIVLGQDFPVTELAVLGDRLRRNEMHDVRCAYLRWSDGAPETYLAFDSAGAPRLSLMRARVFGKHYEVASTI